MPRILLLLVCFLTWYGSTAYAQVPADTASAWNHSLIGSIALSQVAFKDWAQGGESALAWTLNLDGKSEHNVTRTRWTTSYKTAFGQTRQGDRGFRKTDDKIDLETVLIYKMGVYVNPFIASTFKTQFAKGRQYSDNPDTSFVVSQFFDPAYLTQTVGVGYQPRNEVKTRLGAGVRETITHDFNQFSDDPATPKVEQVKVEGGIESVTNVEWPLAPNILFTGKFEAFFPFETFNEPILRSDTTLAMKVNNYISANINVQILKDILSSPRTQIKQALSIGISYSVF